STALFNVPAVRSRTPPLIACVLGAAVVAHGCLPHPAPSEIAGTHWLGTWEAAPQLTEPRNLPPAPGLTGRTLRQVIHVSLGGSRWRLRFSNEFGDGPLVIASAHVARTAADDA